MRAYLEHDDQAESDGEIQITGPDPVDGSYIIHVNADLAMSLARIVNMHHFGAWIRVVPENKLEWATRFLTSLKDDLETGRVLVEDIPLDLRRRLYQALNKR